MRPLRWCSGGTETGLDQENGSQTASLARHERKKSTQNMCLTMWKFIGPGYMVAVGYMDPGNWATDIQGGATFGYSLLFVVLLSGCMAMYLQALCIKLGVVTRRDLAQMCALKFGPKINIPLYILCETAVMATDLAEVIGSAVALNLLTGLPLVWGVVVTALDVLVLLFAWGRSRSRLYELLIVVLVGTVGICYIVELVLSKPDWVAVIQGYIPESKLVTDQNMLYLAIGIVGATSKREPTIIVQLHIAHLSS
jgi:manganese transport protein